MSRMVSLWAWPYYPFANGARDNVQVELPDDAIQFVDDYGILHVETGMYVPAAEDRQRLRRLYPQWPFHRPDWSLIRADLLNRMRRARLRQDSLLAMTAVQSLRFLETGSSEADAGRIGPVRTDRLDSF